MDMLEYYFLVNSYILFFWIFFHFILKNETAFQKLRIYLIASIFVSILLPYMQIHIRSDSFSYIYSQIPINKSNTEISTILLERIFPIEGSKTSIGFLTILKYMVLAGILMSFILSLFKHLTIHSLINKSEERRYRNLYVKITAKPIIPILYNNTIIVPNTISNEEMDIVLEHEYQHYKLGHYIDNFLLQIFQIIFWINPIIYLLINDLKQIHEYQADKEIIKSGIDASIYKLALIKFSIGFQKFAIANGLSNCKIKNRLVMMNNISIKKWKWKFLLFIPAFFAVFLILSFTTSDNDSLLNSPEQQGVNNETIELSTISYEELRANNNSDYIILMINRKSQLLINGKEKCAFDEINEKVSNSFQRKVSDAYKQLNSNLLINTSLKIKFVIQKSTQTNQGDYDKMLDYISTSIFNLREIYSNKLFGKSYNLLESSDKDLLNNFIQPRIYTLPDKNI
ncbi:MAG: M56 family metallopeptidase [Paludibacter sp.]|nr:M56 family metallopeptidase [Paludibacter sp.]MDD4428305.1 M56 family metallopeptidase [Paludibacter sp.]